MLAAEEGRARLRAVADEGWREAADGRVGSLEPELRSVAEAVLSPGSDRWDLDSYEQRRQQLWTAATALDDLPLAPLSTVMQALHPGLGTALASWWVAAQAQPYTRGWRRRGFRAPGMPELTRRHRIDELVKIVATAGPFAQAPEWFAAWAPHLNTADPTALSAVELGPLLAGAIDAGGESGEATFRTLVESGNGQHTVGVMGRHVIVGLLRSSRPDGWEFIESMLLAAQRQEGLRQAILEAADEAHPDAFTRIVDLVVEEDLIRFAATIRAVSVWFGSDEHAARIDDAARRLDVLRTFRSDRDLAARHVLDGDAWDTYAGLCAIAQFDVAPAIAMAQEATGRPQRDTRAASLRFLVNADLPDDLVLEHFTAMTADPDLAVAMLAHHAIVRCRPTTASDELYLALDAVVRRLPDVPSTGDPVGIDPEPVPLDRGLVVDTMLDVVGDRPLQPLLDHFPSMHSGTRSALARTAAAREQLDGDVRRVLFQMVEDHDSGARYNALKAMETLTPDADEVATLEALLTRQAKDLRRGVITLLSRLPVEAAVDSACRLWSGVVAQRDAACELLSVLDRVELVVDTADSFARAKTTARQKDVLATILEGDAADPTLGLYHPDQVTPPRAPEAAPAGRRFVDPASLHIAEALDDLAEAHRNTAFQITTWHGAKEVLLADVQWLLSPFQRFPPAADGVAPGMVLPEVFATWWRDRPEECRGESDQLDALRALVAAQLCADYEEERHLQESFHEMRSILRPLVGEDQLQLRHPRIVRHVLEWILADLADVSLVGECVEAAEGALALVPDERVSDLATAGGDWRKDWRRDFLDLCPWISLVERLFVRNPLLMTSDRLDRWYGLMRWVDRPIAGAQRLPVNPAFVHAAHAIGASSDADVYEGFLDPDFHHIGRFGPHRELREFTRRRRGPLEARYPTVLPLADRVRERIIAIERARGELPTPASRPAQRLASIEGADITLHLLGRLGRSTLLRSQFSSSDSRDSVYSQLIQVSYPAADDTPDVVSELVARYTISDTRLVELAMFAPQWAPTVEQVLGWEGLEDGIWWFHAHTKDDGWYVEGEVQESWAARSAERTPLSAVDLTDGAVDVAWFGQAHARLGPERWSILHKSAKLAAGGAGHRRAQLFAEAMRGDVDESDLVKRMTTKRHQDSVRALGLLPLPRDDADAVALRRYQLLREFERGSKAFGQQKQRSEATAVRIGIENLARTTGATDPQRFVWAMETAEAGDLADGPTSVVVDDVVVTLSVDVEGLPGISVRRGDKSLKSVPATLRKHGEIKALTDRKTALTRQASRVRRSLEDAMVRQDEFTDADLLGLDRHPVVAPMLEMVIWTDDSGSTFRRRGRSWVDAEGSVVDAGGVVRIAHPVDLLGTGHWIDWQERFFDEAERQPFKQAFRELYVLTEAEALDSPASRRWSGHQLQPSQAQGLFTARGWLSDRESGEVAKVFHHDGLVARISFLDGWGTPAEVELPTIDAVHFTTRNEYAALPLDSVPPVLFSETMRDLDLVVSVAHAGGVDPEATASTIEMRAALVRETARIMRLDNVAQQSHHVLIEGALGEYSVHLGSGTVHRRPGGALCIIPVDAQRRGRVFLPFADDDPKTAEIVSKVLMLARDSTIEDPTILEQLRS